MMKRLTVDAYELHELSEPARQRVIKLERESMQGMLHVIVADEFRAAFCESLDGVDDVAVESWALHYHAHAALSANVTDPAAFVASLGMLGYDYGESLGIAEGGDWYSYVWRFDGDDERIDERLTQELERVSRDVVRAMEDYWDAMESDEAVTELIEDLGVMFLADGHAITDEMEVDA